MRKPPVPLGIQRIEVSNGLFCRLDLNCTQIHSALTVGESDDEIDACVSSWPRNERRPQILQEELGHQFGSSARDFRLRLRVIHINAESVGLCRLRLQNRTTSS